MILGITAEFDRDHSMQQRLTPSPEQPPPEPEIYPPGATIPRERIWISAGTQGTQRIYVTTLGPVGLTRLALIVGTMAVLALFLALGAALITVAVGAVLAIGAIVSAVVHRRLRRFR
jgi:hypothetical protein